MYNLQYNCVAAIIIIIVIIATVIVRRGRPNNTYMTHLTKEQQIPLHVATLVSSASVLSVNLIASCT